MTAGKREVKTRRAEFTNRGTADMEIAKGRDGLFHNITISQNRKLENNHRINSIHKNGGNAYEHNSNLSKNEYS